MRWDDFQSGIYDLTLKDTQSLNTQIIHLYDQATKDITQQISGQYVKYLNSVGTIDYYNEMIKYHRLEGLLADIKKSYVNYSLQAQKYVENIVAISASNSYYRSVYATSWLVDGFQSSVGVPYELINLITYGTSDAWKKIPKSIAAKYGSLERYIPKSGTLTKLLLQNRYNEVFKLQTTITAGLRKGLSYENMVQSVADIIGGVSKTKEGISATGAVANAMKLIRTEGNRAMNSASYAATKFAESEGVKVQKQWLCTLDDKTRDTHSALDGVTIDTDDFFKIGDDKALFPGEFSDVKNNVNCRCTTIDIVNGNQPALRMGTNPTTGEPEPFSFKSFNDWRKEQGLTTNKYGEIYSK